MAKKKSKPKSKKAAPKKSAAKTRGNGSSVEWLPKALLAAKLVFAVALATGLVWGLFWTNGRARALVAQDRPDIEITWLAVDQGGERGSWPPIEQQSLMLSRAYEAVGDDPSPFGTESLARIRDSVLASGWVIEIESIAREGERRVIVEPRWAIPAAVVRGADSDYLISADGRPLPLRYRQNSSAWKYLVGVPFDPARAWAASGATEPIGVDSVQAGLSVLGSVMESAAIDQITGFDVSDPTKIALITDRATRVIWGAPPGRDRPGEVGTPTKLERLNFFRTSADDGYRVDAGLDRLDISGRSVLIDETGG